MEQRVNQSIGSGNSKEQGNILRKWWFIGAGIMVMILLSMAAIYYFWGGVGPCIGNNRLEWKQVGGRCFFQVDGKVQDVAGGKVKVMVKKGEVVLQLTELTKVLEYVSEDEGARMVSPYRPEDLVDMEVMVMGVREGWNLTALQVVQYMPGVEERFNLLDSVGRKL